MGLYAGCDEGRRGLHGEGHRRGQDDSAQQEPRQGSGTLRRDAQQSRRPHALTFREQIMSNWEHILYEEPAEGIARIVLNRPSTLNAQDTQFLYELNEAYDRATQDEAIKVIITAANGKHFSSGHDLRERDHLETQDRYSPVTNATGYHRAGAEGRQAREEE